MPKHLTQKDSLQWINDVIGSRGVKYRTLAFLEEAFEAAFAAGISSREVVVLLGNVAARPLKDREESLGRELGDCLSTLYALAECAKVDVHAEMNQKVEENTTLERIAVIQEKVRRKEECIPYSLYLGTE